MYISKEEEIKNIYDEIKGLKLYPFEGETIIDPAYDVGDILVIDGRPIIYQGEIEYEGKFKASIKSKIQPKTEKESMQTKQSNATKLRRVQSNIDQIEGKIEQIVEEQDETSSKLSRHEQTIDSMKDTISSVETKVETAQSTANTANTNAQDAQKTANSNATKITNNTTKITEVEKTVTGLSSKVSSTEETIKTVETKADNANNKIDNLKIGGRNFLIGTTTSKSIAVDKSSGFVTFDPYSTNNKKTLVELGFKAGDKVTVSFNWNVSQNGSLSYIYGNCRLEWLGASGYLGVIKNPAVTFSSSNTSGKVIATVELTSITVNAHTVRIRIDNSVLTFTVSNMKLEQGNINTDWTPAPEDIENTLNTNYYTKTETNSQILQESGKITSAVEKTYSTKTETANAKTEAINSADSNTDNKLKNYTTTSKLGTYIEQTYEHVKVAWNQISEFIQMMIINNNASFAILDNNKKVMAYFDKTGEHFCDSSGNVFGEMGVQKVDNNNYISFSVQGDYETEIANGMAWGIKTKTDNKFHPIFYIENFSIGEKDGDAHYGELVLSNCNLILDGVGRGIVSGGVLMYGEPSSFGGLNFVDNNTGNILLSINPPNDFEDASIELLNNIKFFKNQAGSNTLKVGNAMIVDDGTFYGKNIANMNNLEYMDGSVWTDSGKKYGMLYCTTKDGQEFSLVDIATVSDKRLKKNINETKINALEIINQIEHKEFDWKSTGKHENIGYIAQQLETLDENYVIKVPKRENEFEYRIDMLPLLATTTKAMQEQQEEIEELKTKDKQKEELIQNLISRIEKLERSIL